MTLRVDQIFIDLLRWIHAVVWWNKRKIQKRPYIVVSEQTRRMGNGLLQRVIRPPELCPRDVHALIYKPFRVTGRPAQDYHLVCDSLEGESWSQNGMNTHRIAIMKSRHFPDENGFYETEEVCLVNGDFQGQSKYPNTYIPWIMFQLACVLDRGFEVADWPATVERARLAARNKVVDTSDQPRKAIIAQPYDEGTNPVRIKLD